MCRYSLLLLALCMAVDAAAHEIDRTPASDLEELQARIADTLEQHDVPGAGIALFNSREIIWSGGVGVADHATNAPVTAATLFRAGSVSKSFVAIGLLRLAEQGKLDLQARVKDLAPEIDIQNPWHNSDPVRVVHLLEHTAGFDDMHFKDTYNLEDDPELPLLGAVNRGYAALQVRWRPGTRFAYSNPGYGVAGYLLEKISGQPYERYLAENVFAPLGMRRSTFRYGGGELDDLSRGYAEGGTQAVINRPIYLRPAGNLLTTSRELAVFGQALLNDGVSGGKRLLAAESVKRMERPATTLAAQAGLHYGYGLGVHARVVNGFLLLGHSGGIDGYISYYGYNEPHDFGYAVLLNSAASSRPLTEIEQIILAWLGRDAVPDFPAVANVADETLASYAGYYRHANPRNEILHFIGYLLGMAEIVLADDKLVVNPLLGESRSLVAVTKTLFRGEDQPVATAVFVESASGEIGFSLEDGFFEKTDWLGAHAWRLLVGVSLVLLLSTILFAIVWLTRLALGRLRGVDYFSVRLLPLAAAFSLSGAGLSLVGIDLAQLASLNVRTVGYTVFTILFALLSLGGLVQAVRAFNWPIHAGVRIHSLLVSLGATVLTVYLGYWGMIGLWFWAW